MCSGSSGEPPSARRCDCESERGQGRFSVLSGEETLVEEGLNLELQKVSFLAGLENGMGGAKE